MLKSALHEYWAWARGSTLKGDLRYTNITIFETFRFPSLPDGKYDPRIVPDSKEAKAVARVAETLYGKRQAACKTLNLGLTKLYNLIKGKTPVPGLDETVGTGLALSAVGSRLALTEEQQTAKVSGCDLALKKGKRKSQEPSDSGIADGASAVPTADNASVVPTQENADAINGVPTMAQRIAELRALHEQLNAAVCACYGWPEDTWRNENEVLSRLLELNRELAG